MTPRLAIAFDHVERRGTEGLSHVRLIIDELEVEIGRSDDGCWADVWSEGASGKGAYVSCDAAPDPESGVGLCSEHSARLGGL
jgi:hypothetical protein